MVFMQIYIIVNLESNEKAIQTDCFSFEQIDRFLHRVILESHFIKIR